MVGAGAIKSIAECLQTEMGSLWLIFTGGCPTAPYKRHRWVRLHLANVAQIESRLTCRALSGAPHTHLWGFDKSEKFPASSALVFLYFIYCICGRI